MSLWLSALVALLFDRLSSRLLKFVFQETKSNRQGRRETQSLCFWNGINAHYFLGASWRSLRLVLQQPARPRPIGPFRLLFGESYFNLEETLQSYILVFAGGGIGAALRYWLSGVVHERFGSAFPYGTLAVNVLGCFVIGIVMASMR